MDARPEGGRAQVDGDRRGVGIAHPQRLRGEDRAQQLREDVADRQRAGHPPRGEEPAGHGRIEVPARDGPER